MNPYLLDIFCQRNNIDPTSVIYMTFYFSGSLSVNVSITSGKEFLNAGQLSVSSSTRDMLFELLPTGIIGVLIYTLVLK